MKTVTITKKEYEELRSAKEKLEEMAGAGRTIGGRKKSRVMDDEDLSLLGLAEKSFQFWDNPDDAIYDRL
jgi:hypothetical protein